MKRRAWLLGVAALLLLISGPVLARLGGGDSFSSSSSSSSSGGDSSDLIFTLIDLLIRLFIAVPESRIPILLLVLGAALWMFWASHYPSAQISSSDQSQRQRTAVPSTLLTPLLKVDPNFSRPVFIDFFNLLYARARTESAASGEEPLAGLKSYVSPEVRAQLSREAAALKLESVERVLIGSMRIADVRVDSTWTAITVSLEANYRRLCQGQAPEDLYSQEVWALKRKTGVLSKAPDEAVKLGCPSCGNPGEMGPDGTCPYCKNKVDTAQFDWMVSSVQVTRSQSTLGLISGDQAGFTDRPTLVAPDLDQARHALFARDPDLSSPAIEKRVNFLFLTLQKAWSERQLEQIRPYETDSLFSSHRYWIEAYLQQGLTNRLEDVTLEIIEIAKVELDAFYESITVRVWAHMKDSTVDADGKVVAGDPSTPHRFSEYWTLIRKVGHKGNVSGDVERCPSCGAPLDKVGMTGICGYCDSKITRGDFDWVLSLIEQDSVYTG